MQLFIKTEQCSFCFQKRDVHLLHVFVFLSGTLTLFVLNLLQNYCGKQVWAITKIREYLRSDT